jgi:GT2 family glycosyltransferase
LVRRKQSRVEAAIDISILLATYGRDEALKRTLESLTRVAVSEVTWELVVVDNLGDASTRALVAKVEGAIKVRYLVERAPGKNAALNRGIPEARGSLFVFTDDDVIVSPDWLEQMWAGARRWPRHYVFAGRILPLWPGDRPTPLASTSDPIVLGALGVADWKLAEGPIPAIRVWGGNMAVRASVFRDGIRFNPDVGPRGEDYVMGSETELTKRLERAGLRAVYLPGSVVSHQIRSEQLERAWLYKRAFRSGRGLAQHAERFPSAPRLFGVPRFLWRKLGETALKRLVALVSSNPERALRHGMQYWTWRGYLHECRPARRGGE